MCPGVTFPPLLLCAWSWNKNRGSLQDHPAPPALSLACVLHPGTLRCAPLRLCCFNTPQDTALSLFSSLSSPQNKCCSVSNLVSPALLFLFSPLCSLASPPADQTLLLENINCISVGVCWFLAVSCFHTRGDVQMCLRNRFELSGLTLQEATSSKFLKVERWILLNS